MPENENLEQQTSGRHKKFESNTENVSQDQIVGNNTDDRIGDEVESAVIAVKNSMHDAYLTAMKDVFIPRIGMAVRSIKGSSRIGHNGEVQNLDPRDFTFNTEDTPLRLVSSRLDKKN